MTNIDIGSDLERSPSHVDWRTSSLEHDQSRKVVYHPNARRWRNQDAPRRVKLSLVSVRRCGRDAIGNVHGGNPVSDEGSCVVKIIGLVIATWDRSQGSGGVFLANCGVGSHPSVRSDRSCGEADGFGPDVIWRNVMG